MSEPKNRALPAALAALLPCATLSLGVPVGIIQLPASRWRRHI
jgi:hypothetical protein